MSPRIQAVVFALGAGFVFGTGLWLSGMANPRKVLDFLDVTGRWDPSLMLVMAGAVAITVVGYRLTLKNKKPLFEEKFQIPEKTSIDTPLVAGALIFGAGWGIAGYCPGPALTALATLSTESIVFVGAMIAGGVLHALVSREPVAGD
jgi:uncharacterized membrane protein YedE/YeeE